MSADIVLKRYLYLHAAVLFVLTSVIGMVIIRVQAKHLAGEAYVKVHLDGIIAALWLAAISASLDVSTLTFKLKQYMAGAAILYSWTQFIYSSTRAVYGITLSSWFLGGAKNHTHDGLVFALYFVLAPSALVASALWIASFFNLHAGEKKSAASTRAKRK